MNKITYRNKRKMGKMDKMGKMGKNKRSTMRSTQKKGGNWLSMFNTNNNLGESSTYYDKKIEKIDSQIVQLQKAIAKLNTKKEDMLKLKQKDMEIAEEKKRLEQLEKERNQLEFPTASVPIAPPTPTTIKTSTPIKEQKKPDDITENSGDSIWNIFK